MHHSFMAANSEETIKELAVTEDQVKHFWSSRQFRRRCKDPVVASKITVSDDEGIRQPSLMWASLQAVMI